MGFFKSWLGEGKAIASFNLVQNIVIFIIILGGNFTVAAYVSYYPTVKWKGPETRLAELGHVREGSQPMPSGCMTHENFLAMSESLDSV